MNIYRYIYIYSYKKCTCPKGELNEDSRIQGTDILNSRS